jgi:hypothetical protein
VIPKLYVNESERQRREREREEISYRSKASQASCSDFLLQVLVGCDAFPARRLSTLFESNSKEQLG